MPFMMPEIGTFSPYLSLKLLIVNNYLAFLNLIKIQSALSEGIQPFNFRRKFVGGHVQIELTIREGLMALLLPAMTYSV